MFHGWMFDPDGDQAAAVSTRSNTSFGTGRSVNPRTARRLVTASYTSMIAHLLLPNTSQRVERGSAPTTTSPARCSCIRAPERPHRSRAAEDSELCLYVAPCRCCPYLVGGHQVPH